MQNYTFTLIMNDESVHLAEFAALLEFVWMNAKATKVRTNWKTNNELCGCRRKPQGLVAYDCSTESTDGLGTQWSGQL